MPKFKVTFEQWVQELSTVEIEAETAEEAQKLAYTQHVEGDLDLDWSDGSDVDFFGITYVKKA